MKIITITLLTSLVIVLNSVAGGGHDHAHDQHHKEHTILHKGEHDHGDHKETYAADELEPEVITHFSESAELFVEFPPLIKNQSSTFLAHFTKLSDFKPVKDGIAEVCLHYIKGDKECFEIQKAARKGLFKPIVTPSHSGKAVVSVNLYSPTISSHTIGEFEVAASVEEYHKNRAEVDESEDEGIAFLKEQQWEIAFATAEAKRTKMRPSLLTFGRFEFPSSAHQKVVSPVSGIVIPAPNFRVGSQVKAGDTLGFITPSLGEREDIATLTFQLQRAKANLRLAQSEYKRLNQLQEQNAVSKKRLSSAENRLSIANAELKSIQKRLAQIDPQAESGVAIKSRIDGTIISQNAISGSYVNRGDALFEVADSSTLWLKIQVAQEDTKKIVHPSGVTLHRTKEDLTLSDERLKMLYFNEVIDPKTATASLLYEVDNSTYGFRSGSRFSLRLYIKSEQEILSIPRSAIINDNGVKVVYVLRDGEHFERRAVETGIIDSNKIAIVSGLKAGERVVSEGAYRVFLAGLSPAEAGHGHAH